MTKYTYVKVKVHEGGSYVCAINELNYSLNGDLQDLSAGEKITITFEPIGMTDEEYLNLAEFEGHY